jgi:Zn-dependent peptidase ImmA (M78 family)
MSVESLLVNPSVLRWARERLNLTPEQVAKESRRLARRYYTPVSEKELIDWENGKGEPDLAQLETLAEIYVCPVGWFFLDAPPEEKTPIGFRGLVKDPTALSASTRRTLERFLDLARWTVDLLKRMGQTWEVRIRPGEVSPNTAKAEELAQEYRQRLGCVDEARSLSDNPREAFHWWRRAVENQGVFCFEMPLDPKEVRGAFLWLEEFPFILVNHEDAEAATGRIFTLLHEFAHLVSSNEGFACDFHADRPEQSPEPFANRFAACMLLTPDELRHRLEEIGAGTAHRDTWSDRLLDEIRKPFAVSRDVVAIWLEEIGLAPPGFYERKREQWQSRRPWGKGGRRPSQKEQKMQEIGYSLLSLLVRAAPRAEFSWMDASSVLGMKVDKVEEFLDWARENTS